MGCGLAVPFPVEETKTHCRFGGVSSGCRVAIDGSREHEKGQGCLWDSGQDGHG